MNEKAFFAAVIRMSLPENHSRHWETRNALLAKQIMIAMWNWRFFFLFTNDDPFNSLYYPPDKNLRETNRTKNLAAYVMDGAVRCLAHVIIKKEMNET